MQRIKRKVYQMEGTAGAKAQSCEREWEAEVCLETRVGDEYDRGSVRILTVEKQIWADCVKRLQEFNPQSCDQTWKK